MRRVALGCLGIAAAVAIATPALARAAAMAPTPPRTQLQRFVCHRDPVSLNRYIEVTAVMRPVSGTKHMQMKFQLLQRTPRRRQFTEVRPAGPNDLGKWIHPHNPTLGQLPGDVWSVKKLV